MEIKIIHIKDANKFANSGYTVIRIDRTTEFGNPFYMKSEIERDNVCNKFEQYFITRIDLQKKIEELVRGKDKIALACWCAPLRCHGETIKKYLMLKNDQTKI